MTITTDKQETQSEGKKTVDRCSKCGQQVRYSGSKQRRSGPEYIWQHHDGKKWTTNCSKGGKHITLG